MMVPPTERENRNRISESGIVMNSVLDMLRLRYL